MKTDKIAIATGRKYVDIDAYASMIAYRELLRALGYRNVTASTLAPFNMSVPPLILNLKYRLDDGVATEGAKFIVLDTSNPDFFDTRVESGALIEVIDHHTGFEEYWRARPEVKCQIEFIGSVCTMVYERIVQAGHGEILDEDICKLLIAGILDNTLNLKSEITTERDFGAYRELVRIGGVSDGFYAEYFGAREAEMMKDFAKAIKDDIKIEKVGVLPEVIGQMIVLKIDGFDRRKMEELFAEYPEWMMNVIALEEGKSYIYFAGGGVQERLEGLFDARCAEEGLLVFDKFMLRKEMMRMAGEAAGV